MSGFRVSRPTATAELACQTASACAVVAAALPLLRVRECSSLAVNTSLTHPEAWLVAAYSSTEVVVSNALHDAQTLHVEPQPHMLSFSSSRPQPSTPLSSCSLCVHVMLKVTYQIQVRLRTPHITLTVHARHNCAEHPTALVAHSQTLCMHPHQLASPHAGCLHAVCCSHMADLVHHSDNRR